MLRRVERRAVAVCLVAAAVAWVVRLGDPDVMIGILGGGLLSGASYWALRSGVSTLVRLAAGQPSGGHPPLDEDGPAAVPSPPPGAAARVLRLAWRYALLAFLAYGMIARLRLHPIGLLIGVSSLVVAASLEAFRTTAGSGRQHPRA